VSPRPLTIEACSPSGTDYVVTFDELRDSVLVYGTGQVPGWDTAWRSSLVDECEIMVTQLWQAGITKIFLDGSFVEEKAHPNDIDGYFVCDLMDLATGDLERRLNALDPYKVWTWNTNSRRASRGSAKKQLPMWHHCRVELYPHFGQSSGITDQFGYELQFPSAFRQQRATGEQKGIVEIINHSRVGQKGGSI
jgi:hypothetical protein